MLFRAKKSQLTPGRKQVGNVINQAKLNFERNESRVHETIDIYQVLISHDIILN